MKITYTKNVSTVRFDAIKVGHCFIDTDQDICMKVANDYNCCNVFSFTDKRLYEFSDSSEVIPVEVELLVHAEEPHDLS